MLLPPLQLGITVTASLCITVAHCRKSMKFSNGPPIYISVQTQNQAILVSSSEYCY